MSSELERRLDALLVEAPEPEPGVGERALERAIAALPAPRRREHRRLRAALVLAAAALGLLAVAAGSLAAAGALHVSLGRTRTHASAVQRTLALPPGAAGIAAVVDGRLSVVTRSGFRLQGLPVTAGALSPHALYVAAGIRDSLVAMSPDGSPAWAHRVGGRVVAIAWAPDGLRIAYVVRSRGRLALHVIWGNGTHDGVIDRSVRAVRPSWRADSLELAYIGAGGKAIVYDLAHQSRRIVPHSPGAVSQVAFAPTGGELALRSGNGVAVAGFGRLPRRGAVAGIGWIGRTVAVAGGDYVSRVPVGSELAYRPLLVLGGPIRSFDADGGTFSAVVGTNGSRIVAGTLPHSVTVLSLPPGARVESVSVR